MPTSDERGDGDRPAPAMSAELAELLVASSDGALAPTAFLERLESIHSRHLGSDAELPDATRARGKALAAYDELTLGLDRHHQIELLSHALGIESTPTGSGADPGS